MRALINMGIAQASGRPLVRILDLAEKENLPIKFLEQIFVQLKAAGYLESRRGNQGGYLLALPASEVKFGDVIRLIDGPLAPISCVSRTAYEPCCCPDEAHCGLRSLMGEVHRAVLGVLDRVTLADTVKSTLRRIRRNKASVPFVKMVTKPPRKEPAKPLKPTQKKKTATKAGASRKATTPSRSKSHSKTVPSRKKMR